MSRGFVKIASILTLIIGAQCLSASAVTYEVGSCKRGLTSYPTIAAALAATPSPATVEVCAGNYHEQVVITYGVTLKGIANDGADQVIIYPPSSGLTVNAMDDLGDPVAAQVWIDQTSGLVTISNLTVDGTGNGVGSSSGGPTYVAGIFVEHSSATINDVTTRHQSGNGYGVGIFQEGGTLSSTVTVTGGSSYGIDDVSIMGGTLLSIEIPTFLSVTKTAGDTAAQTNLQPALGVLKTLGWVNLTFENNSIFWDGGFAQPVISIGPGATGRISGNTLVLNGGGTGIQSASDGVAISSNKIMGSATGISLKADGSFSVTGNTIVDSQVAIEFACNSVGGVNSNTIIDAVTGLDQIPSGTTSTETYYDVGTETTNCTPTP
jgi:hypothetical protein